MSSDAIRTRSKLAVLLIVAMVTVALIPVNTASAEANLILNGSFELDTTSWIVDDIDLIYSSEGWFIGDGAKALDLNGFDSGSISQSFDTVEGHNYRVSFRLSANPTCGSGTKSLIASAGDNSGTIFSIATSGEDIGHIAWASQEFFFSAGNTSETLSFVSLSDGACGPMLDSIVVTDEGPSLPTTKAECLKGNWESYGVFKNQGDCVSYVATEGKNPPAYG